MEGSRWLTTYYQQVVDRDTELTPQQLNKEAIYQQYKEIQGLEIRVSQSLSQTQEAETNEFTVTGSGVIYPPVIPNHGDMFLADIGDGKEGCFTLTRVSRATILKQACFEVEYVLVDYATEERREDLKSKTLQELHYVSSYLEHGENPVVTDTEYRLQRSLNEVYDDLLTAYLADFYSRRFETLMVPHQDEPSYDAFVTKTFLAITSSQQHAQVKNLKDLNVGGSAAMRRPTLWSALLALDIDALPLLVTECHLVESCELGTFPYYESVYFSGMQRVVHPKDTVQGVDAHYATRTTGVTGYAFKPGKDRQGVHSLDRPEYQSAPQATGIDSLPDIHPVVTLDRYVLSQAFYERSETGLSKLEVLVTETLEGKPLRKAELVRLASDYTQWESLDRFYYGLVLLLLLIVAKRRL